MRGELDNYRRTDTLVHRQIDFFAQALEEGVDEGIFEVEDIQVSASTVWASLHGTISLLLADRVDIRIEPDTFIDTAIRQAIRGVAPAPSTP